MKSKLYCQLSPLMIITKDLKHAENNTAQLDYTLFSAKHLK